MVDETTVERRTTIADVFLELNLDPDVRIIDVACGIGIVAEDLARHGYKNIDGLDPSKGYIEVANSKGLYKASVVPCSLHFCYTQLVWVDLGKDTEHQRKHIRTLSQGQICFYSF
jgi:predicted TPR repeat methyltransferase